jgi:hypothetical protein
MSESIDSISVSGGRKRNLKKFVTPKTDKFEGYSDDPDLERNFSFGLQRPKMHFGTQTVWQKECCSTQTETPDLSQFMES